MRFLIVGLVTAAILAASAAAAEAGLTESVDFTAKYVKAGKKKFGGLTLRTTISIRDDAGAKPPPLENTTLRFPRGAVVNARYFKKCSQSVLERKGPSGCPASSKIGVGTATGDARPVVGNVNAKVTLFNGKTVHGNPTILIYAQPEISSPLTITGELKRQRTGPYGYVLDVDVPPIPTLPGQPNASVVFFDARTLDRTVRRSGRRIHYIEGPILCNGTFFLLDGAFTYEGGVTHTVYERFTLRGGPRCP
jgi:hypothetical protein